MGYLHRGMLGDQAQQAVDALAVGEVGEPVTLLEGMAIFRLEDRPTLQLLAFEEVRERARGLWLREYGEQAWQELLKRLRADTVITVDEGHYLPLPAGDSGAGQATGTTQ
jgi:parvulin-like peptidyl-prolyl isomerase